MARLADIVPGIQLRGLVANQTVKVIQAAPAGSDALTLFYQLPSGALESTVLFADKVAALELVAADDPWPLDGDGDAYKLASEALRMELASSQDPFLAVRTSRIRPLPHQISAVYDKMLPRLPLRYVLADDPGAGKTIMAGLLIKEMMARGDLVRCLVVCPGSLCVQWQDELRDRFGLTFTILTNDLLEASAGRNAFADHDLLIASLDKLARSDEAQRLLAKVQWDLVVFDEAHKLSA